MVDGPDNSQQRSSDSGGGGDQAVHHPPLLAGHFQLLQEIGSGSSGTVHRARLTRDYLDLEAGTEVAIKFLRPELASDQRARARLFAEGELGRSLHHPNVAHIYGVETMGLLGAETTYLIMQYVRGTTLRALLERSGPPVEDLTRRIGADAATGLFALHRRGLVHRDVKPENLLLTADSELKIVDLGLARAFGSTGSLASPGGSSPTSGSRSSGRGLHGSVAYTAPEILLGHPAGPKGDLYALGIVLFEVTTGQHPFADCPTADEMLDAHLHRTPPRPSHLRPRVSPLLENVLLALLQKDPDDRPRSAADVARILQQGEHSEYWRKYEAQAPILASSRRLQRMRRPAETELFGRRSELQRLDQLLAKARRGHGSAIAVTGPEGTGRRRLLDAAMMRWLDGSEAPRILGGEADSGLGHGEPFASSLLDLLLRGDDPKSPNAESRAVARARERFGLREADATALVAVAFGDSREPSEARANRLAEALLMLAKPGEVLVLRVDHADDLDTSGRLVLQRLLRAAPEHHLLVLLAAGPDTDVVAPELRLELGGLDRKAFRDFGTALFRTPVPPHVGDYLARAHPVLSGLPGSLLEALDHLVQNGELRGRAGDYHDLATTADPRPAPQHLERFRLRVQSLEPAQRTILAAAAILGERSSIEEICALILEPELSVLETLSLFRGRIVRAQGGEVSFRHRDFRQALLRSLPDAERQRLHAAAAVVVEARGARPLEVGMHRSQALDHEGCLDPLLEALENRVQADSRRTALRLVGRLAVHFRHVADDEANRRRRLRFLELSGLAHQNADQRDAAHRSFRATELLARELDDIEASAAARIGLANGDLDGGRMLSALALLETVHDDLDHAARDRDDGTGRRDVLASQAHALHGRILLYLGQAHECLRHLQAARHRVPDEPVDLRCNLWIELARGEALAHRYAHAMRTLRAIEKEDPVRHVPRTRLRFHLYRGQVRLFSGDPEAGQDLRLVVTDAEHLAMPVFGARAAILLGERAFLRNRDDEASAHLEHARSMAQATGDRLGDALARAHLLRLGGSDATLQVTVEQLGLPEIEATWLLALAGSDRALPDTRARLDALLDNADLPLPLHLRALLWLERPASARSLVRSLAERFAQRKQRQRFTAQWQGRVRI